MAALAIGIAVVWTCRLRPRLTCSGDWRGWGAIGGWCGFVFEDAPVLRLLFWQPVAPGGVADDVRPRGARRTRRERARRGVSL